MTPQEFQTQWCIDEDEILILFSEAALAGISIPEKSREFLIAAGLPDAAAPFLEFQTPDEGALPQVSERWGLGAEYARYRSIGFNDVGDPICIDEAEEGRIVCLDHDFNFRLVLMNSSIPALAESLLAYRQLVLDTQERNGEDAWLDGDVPDDLREWLGNELKRIDPVAMEPDCFWSQALTQFQ